MQCYGLYSHVLSVDYSLVCYTSNYPRITCNIISVQCHLGEINLKKNIHTYYSTCSI